MKTLQTIFALVISITLLFSCEKDENQEESNLPKSYLDYDNFISKGLVAYYPFNGNADDYSENEQNGIGYNVSYSYDRFDKPDGACLFDGNNSYINIENSELLNGSTYTICFWYRADVNDTLIQSIISKSDTSRYGYSVDLYNSDHITNLGFTFRYEFGESWSEFGSPFKVWTSEIERQYKFAAFAFSENDFIDYFEGIKENHQPAIYFNDNDYNLYIGKSNNKRYKKYKGELDDLLIYNRILTYDEIEKLYNWDAK